MRVLYLVPLLALTVFLMGQRAHLNPDSDPSITATGWSTANHAHLAANSGGQITEASLSDLSHTPLLTAIGNPAGDTTFTFGDSEEIDWVFSTEQSDKMFLINFNQTDDGDATDTVSVFHMDITSESDDTGDILYGMRIIYENGAANTILDAAIFIDNAETTTATMTDAILITSTGVGSGVTDGIDVSHVSIDNAINIGTNNIDTGGGGISSTELDRLSGINAALVDLNDSPAWSGAHDFTSGFLEIPNGATPVVTGTAGRIALDTTDNQLLLMSGSEIVVPTRQFKCGHIQDVVAADEVALWLSDDALTITQGWCRSFDATTVEATLVFSDGIAGTDMTGTITCQKEADSVSKQAITGSNTLVAFEELVVDITNTPTADQDILVCFEFTTTRE